MLTMANQTSLTTTTVATTVMAAPAIHQTTIVVTLVMTPLLVAVQVMEIIFLILKSRSEAMNRAG